MEVQECGWLGAYKATVIDSKHYLLSFYRYIELNLVRAAMVTHPSEYPWSSYAINAIGAEDSRKLLTPHYEYLLLGNDAEKRTAAYRALFKTKLGEKTLEEIRESTNKLWILDSDEFKAQIEERTGRVAAPRLRGGDKKSAKLSIGSDPIDFNDFYSASNLKSTNIFHVSEPQPFFCKNSYKNHGPFTFIREYKYILTL